MRTVPSYKSQVKDDGVSEALLNALKVEIKDDPRAEINCLYYVQKYLTIVRDKHLSASARSATVDFQQYDYRITDDLTTVLNKAAGKSDSLTGIYNLDDVYRVAVVPDDQVEGRYLGVVLESTNRNWQPKMIKFVLTRTPDGYDGLFYGGAFVPDYQRIQPREGRLYPERWIKTDAATDYAFNPYLMDEDLFQYRMLDGGTHYVRLGSFSGQNKNYAMASKLREEMESKIQVGNVIVDLRNNGGGGSRTSDLFLDFLKKNKKNLRVFVLQNYFCGSDCEQFLVKLKSQQSVTAFGENTHGAIAYGFGNRSTRQETTPCYKFTLNLTEKKYEKYLDYEEVGIAPDQYLHTRSDWIEQVLGKL
ncbi:hypothetical protein GCM10007390_21470 [Persicitalea jodogahamensis]|uniref:Tail specific protease domain-containing protein n=1 Tax=Persicitalea jodogahamensis TaxID=402147 RepID=A0A8J3G9L8_9BACT|nr:hypothetical protein GCM10007390_21470 [Persicitalea jodogahamensis]